MGYYSSYIVMIPFLIFTFYAQHKVKSTFKKYTQVRNRKGLSGAEVANMLIQRNGLTDVSVERSNRGQLSDHYDPRSKTVRLSPEVYSGQSMSAVSVAAHEVGHAIQHAKAYAPLKFRSILAPAASFASRSVMFIVIGGFIFGITGLIDLGIIIFSIVILFQIVTLPVEFNASSRALTQLESQGIVYTDEISDSKKVLNAAALTYVAAAAASVGHLIRLLILRDRRG
ncbi:MAG TPA: zinc metallopeptidase [Clostridia bacterium]|nr:zinc metallopeptidase [Clostridia bacterium]